MASKTVFITGAAAGIGRKAAVSFARKGYTVGGYDIDEVGLKSLKDEIEDLGGTAVVGHLNVTDADEFAERLAEFTATTGGRLDVLVNNAGILVAGKFEELKIATIHREIDINTKGVANGLHAAFPYLKATKGSVAISMASASAIYGQAELASYSATKHYVRAITEALDIEWGSYGIRLAAIWPLYVQTAMTENIKTGTTDSLGIKLGPQDVADVIVKAAEPGLYSKLTHQIHWTVGTQTALLAMGSRFSPIWLTRLVNKRLAHGGH
ncbi:SDR family oxidoreductase [Williamsia sp. CHRR-6]|uniref:SDR family oxidoreductase n=1 Tax=Williamsia sp. CHRR-6 TaxID=2835871 RepID=UPI001BD966FE|nr:SDR family oxidoreductase [Williamsia sp. CHRR-6]MBT0567548.1 SDR family oxidoreductase [Williamsia sp. CHRR-6]